LKFEINFVWNFQNIISQREKRRERPEAFISTLKKIEIWNKFCLEFPKYNFSKKEEERKARGLCIYAIKSKFSIWNKFCLVQSNLAIRNCLIRNKLVLRNHFPLPICHLLHKDKELLALKNNFRTTKKFLIACISKY
jgi:hypothetical protein